LYGDLFSDQHLEEADFDWATDGLVVVLVVHLHVSIAVEDDAVIKGVEDFHVGLEVFNFEGLVDDVDAGYVHVASGESGRLTGQDINHLTRGLKGVEVLD
jgi:hypothetical protein